ncbi:efflux RND transporter permease subunit [Leptothrix discophora]|uniref:Efflux RND transporter permease subunit n=1 Tax=Leptothrix discophora TaxID=89 RepID=A0ABT9G6V3_LEPDI|nr:efflux RND transporter permease subunit [Leptothrix discophora]MDP4302211.1 efflux RND transporter permease subunit [Leptothrix discophora]
MNVSAWSIRHPIPAVMLFVLLTLAGLMSFRAMKIQNFPDLDLPTVSVSAALPGAAPAQLETEVARKIENAVAALQGVKHIYSKVQDGVATVTVEFRLEKPTQEAVDDVRDAVNRIRADLPGDLRDPQVSKLNLAGTPILTYTIASSRLDEEGLSWFVDNDVTKALLSVNGVGSVARVGGVTRELRVELDPSRLLALGVTASDVSRQLRAVQQDASGGRTDWGGSEQSVRTIATVKSAEELAALDIPLSDGRRIRLSQVAQVSDTVAEQRSAALLDGAPVVGFEITRSRGASEVDVDAGVRQVLDRLLAEHPDLRFDQAFNMVEPVVDNYDGSLALLYEGAILAIIVVWFFLRDWRATFVAATALPLSVVPAFIGMWYLGFSVNVVTLLSLSLVVGILVDDAIVEIENIVRHLRMGKSPYQAAMEAADEIGLAVIATTFTLIAVFLPTAFMAGIPGKFFKQFGWTASLAVFASLVVARVLTPMMSAYLLKPIVAGHGGEDGRIMKAYLRAVAWSIRHRLVTAIGAFLFFVGSIMLVPLLPTGFIPADDFSQSQVTLELPPGSTFGDTLAAAEQARAIVQANPMVTKVYTAVGGGASGSDPFAGGGVAEVRKATLTLTLKPRDQRKGTRKQVIERDLREAMQALPGARVTVGLGGSGEKYVLVLSGNDGNTLLEAAQAVERDLRSMPGLGNIASTASLVRPELVIRPDATLAADAGVTSAAIADTLRIATAGDFDSGLSKLNLAQRQVPIVVRLPDAARRDPALLGQLTVPGRHGPMRLANIAQIGLETGPAQIDRFDRQRNINFEVELNGQPLGDVAAAVEKLPSVVQLPAGVTRANFGDAEVMGELFASFGLAMLTGVLCIYIVLVLLFGGFMQPVTILAALPLSLGGAFVALLVTKSAFSMPSLIGLIMLMGIATKNSILLVDYAIIARREGKSRYDALIDACHKRARPIVMTTIAMGAGMLPIALGLGTDPSFRQPMAVAVIGGLITSTFLSLLVVPVVFTYIDDLVRLGARLLVRRAAAAPAGSANATHASTGPA